MLSTIEARWFIDDVASEPAKRSILPARGRGTMPA
jgi:hypothetical protein